MHLKYSLSIAEAISYYFYSMENNLLYENNSYTTYRSIENIFIKDIADFSINLMQL